MNGKFRITHKDLKVNILDKDTKEKKKFLSAVANLVVKKDSKKFWNQLTSMWRETNSVLSSISIGKE
jgi:hypothetical protein